MADAPPPTAFRLSERKYRKYKKSRRSRSSPPPTDFSDVLDARAAQCSHDTANVSNVTARESAKQRRLLPLAHDDGGTPRVYAVDGVDGLLVVPNAVSPAEQVPLLLHCMREYAAAPHQLNITCSEEEHRVGLWSSYVSALEDRGAEYCDANTAISKLHWSTLGFHHNWSTNYYEPHQHTEMPRSLLEVVSRLQDIVRSAVQGASCAVDVQALASISPEAAIVNYYHSSRTLNGHVDHSEFTFLSPIYSISLGNSAVFLIGGVTKDVEPTALFLHSGDLLVMGGKSRVCHHGVPRILDGTTPDPVLEAIATSDAVSSEQERRALLHYMKSHRLNLNVRQVLPTPDHEFSTETNEERRLRFIAELERTSGDANSQEREGPVALAHKRQRDEECLVESGKKVKREERIE